MNLTIEVIKLVPFFVTLIFFGSGSEIFAQTAAMNEEGNQTPRLIDIRDGKQYKTMRIGNQVWMAENLAYKATTGCWPYLNDNQNIPEHGYLYTWQTAIDVCPDGWELPTKSDYTQLLFLIARDNKNPSEEIIEGGCSGFEATQSGWRTENGDFFDLNENGNYWTRSKSFRGRSWLLFIGKNGRKSYIDFADQRFGMSVRCIKK